jgi:hypothetical protein
LQTDAIVNQLDRMADTMMFIAIGTSIVALFALAIAVVALMTLIRVRRSMERGILNLSPKTQPMVIALTRVAENAREVSDTVKVRVKDLLDTVDDLNDRLKTGADAVEARVRDFGVVIDVVQGEAERIMVDAASTARGVHTAREALRDRKAGKLPPLDLDPDEDPFD